MMMGLFLSLFFLAYASLTLTLRTKLYQRVKTDWERKIFHRRAPKVMGIWMKHLSLQGFAAGSFVSGFSEDCVWMCKHLRSIKLSAGNGSCKKPGPFFYLSPCHCTRPWDFYNPNWYSQGNLFHCSSLPWKDSFSCGHFSSPGWITATGVAFLTLPWQGLCLANLNLSYFAPIHLVLFDLSAPVCGFTDHFLITLPPPSISVCRHLSGDFLRHPLPPAPTWQIINSNCCSWPGMVSSQGYKWCGSEG